MQCEQWEHSDATKRALHLLRRCHLRQGVRKLHPVGWDFGDYWRIGRVRWRRGEKSGLKRWLPGSSWGTMAPNAPPKPLSHVSTDIGAMWIAGNLTMKKNKLSIRRATAKIGGAYQQSWSHSESVISVISSLRANGLRSAAAELYRTFCVIPPCVSFPIFSHWLVDSEVAFGSVGMWLLKMQWPPSTSATCHGVVGRPSSCYDVSSQDIWYYVDVSRFRSLELKPRCHHVRTVFAWMVTARTRWKTTLPLPQIRAFCAACHSHQVAPFAFEAMRWKMEVASERLEMSMLWTQV